MKSQISDAFGSPLHASAVVLHLRPYCVPAVNTTSDHPSALLKRTELRLHTSAAHMADIFRSGPSLADSVLAATGGCTEEVVLSALNSKIRRSRRLPFFSIIRPGFYSLTEPCGSP